MKSKSTKRKIRKCLISLIKGVCNIFPSSGISSKQITAEEDLERVIALETLGQIHSLEYSNAVRKMERSSYYLSYQGKQREKETDYYKKLMIVGNGY